MTTARYSPVMTASVILVVTTVPYAHYGGGRRCCQPPLSEDEQCVSPRGLPPFVVPLAMLVPAPAQNKTRAPPMLSHGGPSFT